MGLVQPSVLTFCVTGTVTRVAIGIAAIPRACSDSASYTCTHTRVCVRVVWCSCALCTFIEVNAADPDSSVTLVLAGALCTHTLLPESLTPQPLICAPFL